MRVCHKHRCPAVNTFVDRKTGEEHDLCAECDERVREIIYGKEEQIRDDIIGAQKIKIYDEIIKNPIKKLTEISNQYGYTLIQIGNNNAKSDKSGPRKRSAKTGCSPGRPKK